MIEGLYRFAGHNILIRSHYDSVQELCWDYRAEGEPEMIVEPSMEEIRREQEISDRENQMEGKPLSRFPESYLEHLAVYRKIAQWMVTRNTLLLHGSVIAVDGAAYLFTAKSGTGKSTHARLWRELFQERAIMVNDDKPLLIVGEEKVMACGTPWNGKHHLGTNISLPLQGIAILNRGEENTIEPADEREAFAMLIQQAFRPEDPVLMARTMELLDRIRRCVPVWNLHCNMELSAARVAHDAMSQRKGSR